MTNMSSGITQIKETVDKFKLHKPLAQLVFLQVRQAVGGITNEELIAYRRITALVIDTINENNESSDRGIEAFHVKANSKDKKFKNKHIAIMLEAVISDYYVDFFGVEVAQAIVEQDERFLNTIMAERLPSDFGSSVIIALTGDVDKDVSRLDEITELLLTRRVKELAISQSDKIKVKHRNPWQAIRQRGMDKQVNHLVVNYVDNSQEAELNLDLLQQVVYVLGMLKKIQSKEHQKRAALKIAENKRLYEEIHKDLPKEQDVYRIQPDSILGDKQDNGENLNSEPKTINPDSRPKTVANSNPVKINEDNYYNANYNNLDNKKGLIKKIKGFLSIRIPETNSKKELRLEKELLAKKLSVLQKNYLTDGLIDGKQPDLDKFLYTNKAVSKGDVFNGVKAIESVLDASLNNKDEINSNKLDYSSIDVTAGMFVNLNWKNFKNDLKNDIV